MQSRIWTFVRGNAFIKISFDPEKDEDEKYMVSGSGLDKSLNLTDVQVPLFEMLQMKHGKRKIRMLKYKMSILKTMQEIEQYLKAEVGGLGFKMKQGGEGVG